jgi:hypothetical protein
MIQRARVERRNCNPRRVGGEPLANLCEGCTNGGALGKLDYVDRVKHFS